MMFQPECEEIRDIVVYSGRLSATARGTNDLYSRADEELPPIDIVGVDPEVEDGPSLPGESEVELEPVPSATYPDLIPTTAQSDVSSTSKTDEATSTLSSSISEPSSATSSTSISSETSGVSSTDEQPPPTTATEEPPEPSKTEPPPPPFDPGVCRIHITEYGHVDGVMAKITIYDNSDEVIGDNSDSVDFDYDGKEPDWDPIEWGGYYWIYSDALGLNTTFTFVEGIVEKRQDFFFAFTRWDIQVNVGDQVEWNLSALDEDSLPNVSLGGWTFDGSENSFPADEAPVRHTTFPLGSSYNC